ncbi:MAG: hypothetical protein RIR48_2839, partial [Bacteroidota bacterium]
MFQKNYIFILICISMTYTLKSQSPNLFIGTAGHGHTYPGATTPFG